MDDEERERMEGKEDRGSQGEKREWRAKRNMNIMRGMDERIEGMMGMKDKEGDGR